MEIDLSPALQNYLCAMLSLERRKRVARVKDIAESLDVHKSTVSGALHRLARDGWVNYEPYEAATLTERGRKAARLMRGQQLVVSNFLQNVLGVEPERAETTARDVRHALDETVFGRLVCFLAFIEMGSGEVGECLEEFRDFSRQRLAEKSCLQWVEEYMDEAERGPGEGGSS